MRLLLLAVGLSLFVVGDEKLDELKSKLRGNDERAKRSAVQELAKLDTTEAWQLVIGALADPLPQAADEAQLAVAAIDDAPALKLLLGKDGFESKDAYVRMRVTEAFGRMNAPPGIAVFGKALVDKDAGVRRAAAWSIERERVAAHFDGPPPPALLDAFKKDKDGGVRAAALVALARFDAAQVLLGEAKSDAAYEVRAASVLADARSASAFANDRHIGVRICVAESFAAQKTKPAALALVELLAGESEACARWRMVDLLQQLSGLKHRLDARPWRDWANALADDWSGATAKPSEDGAAADKTVTFAGLPILSGHVCFVIDLSGSVWDANAQGKTPKQAIDEELRKTLAALGPEVEFNLIPYTSNPLPWEKSVVPANAKNVGRALDYFIGRRDTGKGNFWDALLLALEDPKVDTVVMFGDGAPTGGRRWNLGLMKQLFAEHNRFRRVVLNAVLADANKRNAKEWVEMCASSGGRVVEISLK